MEKKQRNISLACEKGNVIRARDGLRFNVVSAKTLCAPVTQLSKGHGGIDAARHEKWRQSAAGEAADSSD